MISLKPRALLEVTAKPVNVGARRALVSFLERRNRIETEAEIELEKLGLASRDRIRYQAAGWFTLRRILPRREVGPHDVFLDIGAGMGRAVYQAAALYGFGRVIGVELSPELTRLAQRNIERNRHRLRCANVELIVSDVVDYTVPDDVTVIFCNNPVVGGLFATVVEKILTSVDRRPRRVRFIYSNPVEHHALIASGRFRPTRRLRGWRPGSEWSRSNSTQLYEVEPG